MGNQVDTLEEPTDLEITKTRAVEGTYIGGSNYKRDKIPC